MQEILIAIHGFGRRRKTDFDWIATQFDNQEILFVSMNLYEIDEPKVNWLEWVAEAKIVVEDYLAQGYKVNLLGFSMGGVIATFLASIMPIEHVILVAPAFEYIALDTGTRMVYKYGTILKESEAKFKNHLQERLLTPPYFVAFFDLIKNLKPSVKKVVCPVLIFHGNQDEVVPIHSSRLCYRQLKSKRKQLIIFEGATHELLDNECCRVDAFFLIGEFMKDNFVK